ncbi:Protein OS-9 [Microsporum canis]|uniref:Endoplasmic reticulum lectin n=1 Tax=Arthroderma otae (strain ATCC MYA-4605 / CBS 113480) TaxID=554155 RepID=C5FX10_ARTOC|nr:OS-9 [Microsporum canis CBS 113480]EEQ34850.1 OS-9 [Microsporum canis CBS 113480]
MRHHIHITLTTLLAGVNVASAAHKPFSIQDDVLASPQFEVLFPDEYILESDARLRLAKAQSQHSTATNTPSQPSETPATIYQGDRSDLSQQVRLQDEQVAEDDNSKPDEGDIAIDSYHEMVLNGQRFLCGIPNVATTGKDNTSTPTPNPDEEAIELARATNRGLELLSDLEGKCLYYAAGWWSYSFCYMNEVRQFHARLPGKGVPVYPPAEDPDSTTYVLGRFQGNSGGSQSTAASTEVAALQTKGESWYLVQYLERGTICDLTRKPRKIEVQFHCHPQSPEHIAWIKEITTCSYVMMVYTPRLCNDVAFQPPRVEQPNSIQCREIILPEHVPIWEAAKAAKKAQAKRELVEGTDEPSVMVGDIEVGAMKLVGKDGKRIEKDQFGFGEDEKIQVVAKSEGGKVKVISKETLKKHKVTSEKFERLRKGLDKAADGKDWRLEEVTTSRGEGLRGIIDDSFDEVEGEEDEYEEGETEAEGKPSQDNTKKETKLKLQQKEMKMMKKKTNTKKQQQQKSDKEQQILQKPEKQPVSDETIPEAGSDETYKTDGNDARRKSEKVDEPDTERKKGEDEKDEL